MTDNIQALEAKLKEAGTPQEQAELYQRQNLILEEEIKKRAVAEETLHAFLEKQKALMEINFAICR